MTIEHRSERGAQIIYEYQHPQPNVRRVASTERFTKPRVAEVPPALSPTFIDLLRRANQKCKERLSREMVLLYKLGSSVESVGNVWLR